MGYATCGYVSEYVFAHQKVLLKLIIRRICLIVMCEMGSENLTLRRGNIVNNEGLLSCDYCELKTKPNTPPKRLEI